jgi:hypothetical protein
MYYDVRASVIFGDLDDIIKEKKLEEVLDKNSVNEKYNEFRKPLSNSETNKITTQMMSAIKQYTPSQNENEKITLIMMALSLMLQSKDDNSREFRSCISKFIQEGYGGAARIILDKNLSDEMKIEQMMYILSEYNTNNPGMMGRFVRRNEQSCMFLIRNKVIM